MSDTPEEKAPAPEETRLPDPLAPPRLWENILYGIVWTSGNIGTLLYNRLSVIGRKNIPKTGPVLIVSNHASVMDPPLIGFVCTRRVSYLAKADLFRNALFGGFIRALGAFGIKRGASDRAALRLCGEMLRAGKVLLMFPEGTRTRTGQLGPPQPGAAMILSQAPETQILPVRIEGTFEAWGPSKRFPRPAKVRVFIGKPFTLSDIKDLPEVKKQLYHALSEEIMNRISSA